MKMIEIHKKKTQNIEQIDSLARAVSPARQPATASEVDERLLSTYGRTFHFAAHFLSPKLRRSVVTLYAFFRTLDDLVDEPVEGQRIEDIHLELLAWKSWFKAKNPLSAPQEPLGARLAAVLAEHRVPTALFLDFLDGLTSDLGPQEIIDFNEMYRYCYRVAGTVGLAMTHVLGASSPQALAAAENLGIAMQLTNILRDVGGDLAAGRIYLPQEDLERFGSSRAHLFQLFKDGQGPDDRFRALMRYQVARAHRYYARGMPGIWMLPPNCRLPILIAGRLYRRILTAIEHRDYDVLRSRAATSFPEKMREAAIAFTLDQLWRLGEALPGIEAEALFEN